MKTCDELSNRWNSCQGGQILVDHTHPLKMYLNVNEKGNKELLVPITRPITSFDQTKAIGITNYKHANGYLFAIELLSVNLTKEYVCLCFDLIESSRSFATAQGATECFFETFRKWYSLWMSARGSILSIHEIRGLMGEIKHILDEIESGIDKATTIASWTIHRDACRDFIYDNSWDEIKTIQTSGDYVTVSSLEQLEHDSDGRLVVFRLDRADAIKDTNTYTLNSLVDELKKKLDIQLETELVRKLLSKGYSFDQAYDSFVFKFNGKDCFTVNDSFPRIGRTSVPDAICAVRYDLLLSKIEDWREK